VFSALTKGRRKAAGQRRSGNYPQYVDPENPANTYSRGPVPTWLKEKMIASGYDPANKDQREEFKTSHLQLAA
jgi:DNA-binding protein H-NS